MINNDTSVGQRKTWAPDGNRTHDLPNTGRTLYPLQVSYENSWRAKPFKWVLIYTELERSPSVSFIPIHDDIDITNPSFMQDADFFFVPRSCHCWSFHLSPLIYRAENSPSLSFITIKWVFCSTSFYLKKVKKRFHKQQKIYT